MGSSHFVVESLVGAGRRDIGEREGGGEGIGNSLTKLNFVIIAGTVSSPLGRFEFAEMHDGVCA